MICVPRGASLWISFRLEFGFNSANFIGNSLSKPTACASSYNQIRSLGGCLYVRENNEQSIFVLCVTKRQNRPWNGVSILFAWWTRIVTRHLRNSTRSPFAEFPLSDTCVTSECIQLSLTWPLTSDLYRIPVFDLYPQACSVTSTSDLCVVISDLCIVICDLWSIFRECKIIETVVVGWTVKRTESRNKRD